ncbi:MAG: hypothetical protein PHY62_04365 [Gallionella sp.]|nr:hypothetical protein [Gallionella sp.]
MKSFLVKLRNWFYLKLLKFYYWVQLSVFKKALDLKRWCLRVLDAEIRILEPSLLQIGEVDDDDSLVEYVSRNLTQREITSKIENAAHSRSNLTTELIARSRTSDNVCTVVANYFLAEAYAALQLKEDDRKDAAINNARLFVPDAQPFEAGNIYQLHAKLKKRLGAISSELAERSALRIDFNLSDMVGAIGVTSALFVISGYLYTTVLLGAFGIDVSLFFSLADYLAASIEQIRYAAFSTIVTIIAFAAGLRHSSMRSRMESEILRPQMNRVDQWMLALVVFLAARIAWGAYNNEPSFSEMQILGGLISLWLAERMSKMIFSKPLAAQFALTALFTFVSITGVSLYKQVHDFNAGQWGNKALTKISTNFPLPVASSSLVVIAANNNYVFALSKENRTAYAIPREKIELFEVAR